VYLAVVAIVIALLNEVGGVLGRRADDREEVRA
jgi:hypothetical protein